jgi:hypothetical protein
MSLSNRSRNLPYTLVGLAAMAIAIIVIALTLTSCGKATEPFRDAGVGTTNTANADTITMPDGFSNVATKCDHGNRVYVIYHNNNAYGSVAVVPKDPTCPQ